MPDTTTDPFDAALRRLADALVAEAPDAPRLPDDREIHRDILASAAPAGPTGRRHRVGAVAGIAAVVIVVAGVVAVTRGDGTDGPDNAVLADDAGLEAAPQRLFLDDWRRELPPHGEPVRLEVAGLDPRGSPRPLPGGGHLVVGARPVESSGEGRDEFTNRTGGLAVIDADGQITVERDIEPSTLVGVTATDAVLARQPQDHGGAPSGPVSIVAHDLATGEERLVREDVTFDPARRASARWAVVAGDLVTVEASHRTEPLDDDVSTVVPGSSECVLQVVDLATGQDAERPLDIGCMSVFGLQASPDGSRAAVAYEAGAPLESEVRFAVIDLPTGAVVHDQLLGQNVDCSVGSACPPGARPVDFQGMAWQDASTVRVAVAELATAFDELTVDTIPIG